MTISQVPSSTIEAKPAWKIRFGRVLRSRITFLVLQALDLLTTLAAFHVGAFEVNPLVARFTVIFGAFRGVLISKLIAVMIAMGIRRRLWIVNVFYTGIICWNLLVLFALAWKTH